MQFDERGAIGMVSGENRDEATIGSDPGPATISNYYSKRLLKRLSGSRSGPNSSPMRRFRSKEAGIP
jgi:hypothetical protein